ncbi:MULTISPECIES: Hpt domain-containing protein [unclassified Janthinobacterium]|uniref:Hpt domain-containing protein n=1 Tax=unclassified Janthinobacterium TaxID=2610881 RepID=UPI000887E05C|nr:MULTISPECIES: Hpt domain-containing protein [unclassified Janthinobacterium]SDA75214.1 Hpt domain-containing protein [Janthinobacterium sp. 551a]SFB57783.1 Hpt domain-containing protein [Janthinobacterium sp. 344]
MATLIDPDFRARLRALNDKYAAGVPALMQAIAQAQARCDGEGPRLEPLTDLHRALHAVAGSAATFGFAALGQECRRIEQLVRTLLNEPGQVLAEWPGVSAQVGTLLRWAECNAAAPHFTA